MEPTGTNGSTNVLERLKPCTIGILSYLNRVVPLQYLVSPLSFPGVTIFTNCSPSNTAASVVGWGFQICSYKRAHTDQSSSIHPIQSGNIFPLRPTTRSERVHCILLRPYYYPRRGQTSSLKPPPKSGITSVSSCAITTALHLDRLKEGSYMLLTILLIYYCSLVGATGPT